jgi:hypothetical protein
MYRYREPVTEDNNAQALLRKQRSEAVAVDGASILRGQKVIIIRKHSICYSFGETADQSSSWIPASAGDDGATATSENSTSCPCF